LLVEDRDMHPSSESAGVAMPSISQAPQQRWGILEASRRISEVRLASHARTKAIRERPAPPRDLEVRFAKQSEAEARTLDDLLREEMQ
jgi:hypothetical protein